jgi:serine/threonine protein phosphatase PrpC
MKFDTAVLSEAGSRSENQDAVGVWLLGAGKIAAAVADGLGGHFGGKRASQIAVDRFADFAQERGYVANLRSIAEQIHANIRKEQNENTRYRTMATTLSGAVVQSGLMEFVHCGDSRIVVARNGGIWHLTIDHSEAQRLFASGQLTREALANYPRKNILESALGIQGHVTIDTGQFPLMLGDRVFFTTDGLHNKIMSRELLQIAQQASKAEDAANLLSREMRRRSPDDNYSCICVFVIK